MSDNEPNKRNLGYRLDDDGYEALRKELLMHIDVTTGHIFHNKNQRKKWASDVTALLRHYRPDEAILLRFLFEHGVNNLKEEDKLEKLIKLLPWIMEVNGTNCQRLDAANSTEEARDFWTVKLLRFAESLNTSIFH
ncbi:hypothetical protein N7478_002366 [Penicillium angulare]|uniref:uncharacterized protein n=1 Tax=Penicillium angulare TaxID=116970 RepID=UPI00254117D2|nr:uncharacterized protein N7478_002366 [Penicillium angulare]KAJ5286680.1 hypothetical protein N7478_002366 [Penicillium angulare]